MPVGFRSAATVIAALGVPLAPAAVASIDRPQLRANGNIAFLSTRGEDGTHIYTMAPDGTGQTALTSGTLSHDGPTLSPSGKRIAYSFASDVWVMDADGSDVRRLTNDRRSAAPAWSPDGNRLAFTRTVGRASEIWVMNADGRGKRRLTRGAAAISPVWAPNGAKIAFLRDGELWLMTAGGTSQRRVAKDVTVWAPSWSPDGKRIAYESNVDTGEVNPTAEIWVMNADGSAFKRLTRNRVDDNHPTWSPDGKLIAFSSDRGAGHTHIFVMKPSGTRVRQLTRGVPAYAPGDYSPSWGGRP